MHTPVVLIDNTVDKLSRRDKFMHTPVVLIENTVDKLSQS